MLTIFGTHKEDDTAMSLENLKVSLKQVWLVGALIIGQLVTFSMTVGEYKSKIDGHNQEINKLSKKLESLESAILKLEMTIQKEGIKK